MPRIIIIVSNIVSKYKNWCPVMVEAGGVEPPSENTSSGTSPGADGYLHSLAAT